MEFAPSTFMLKEMDIALKKAHEVAQEFREKLCERGHEELAEKITVFFEHLSLCFLFAQDGEIDGKPYRKALQEASRLEEVFWEELEILDPVLFQNFESIYKRLCRRHAAYVLHYEISPEIKKLREEIANTSDADKRSVLWHQLRSIMDVADPIVEFWRS